MMTPLEKINQLEKRVQYLENENGSLRYEANVAKLSHAQLNKYIAIFDRLGFKGHHIDKQVDLAADELRRLRHDPA